MDAAFLHVSTDRRTALELEAFVDDPRLSEEQRQDARMMFQLVRNGNYNMKDLVLQAFGPLKLANDAEWGRVWMIKQVFDEYYQPETEMEV